MKNINISFLSFLFLIALTGCGEKAPTAASAGGATALTAFQTQTSFGSYSTTPLKITAADVQADDKVIVVGYGSASVDYGSTANVVMMARYTSTGALDTSFGTGGIVGLKFASHSVKARAVRSYPLARS
ncbi:MAG TPA: delta-60 repeat domain-containing protein [Bacteriovoracaceae bacterium]|nr:delta-60 repeat domain-containing protein [Bacteriovoracaceae bacterium]